MNNLVLSQDSKDKFDEDNSGYMGASIENQHLQAGLLERLSQTGKCEIISKKVQSIKQAKGSNERPQITLEDGQTIEPLLLVGSDGEKSLTRTQYNIGTWGHSYNQKGLVCTV